MKRAPGSLGVGLLLTLLLCGLAAPALALDLLVSPLGQARLGDEVFSCLLGRSGVRVDKREGDGATPAGAYPLRRVLYRADKLPNPPATALPLAAIRPDDGWCDDPGHPLYNQPVKLPFSSSHEEMWRADGLYDLVAVLGYNDDPVLAGKGSAIFLHVARADGGPTAGCLAFALGDLLRILERLGPDSRVIIQAPSQTGGDAPRPAP